MVYALKLIGALLGFFLLVPAVVLISTGSWRQTLEATRGYAVVCLILFVIPGVVGCLFAGVMLLLGS